VHKQRDYTKEVAVDNNYNKWSVELAGGFKTNQLKE
jgi:hypothetical protein